MCCVRTGGFGARATTKGGAFRKAKNEIRRRRKNRNRKARAGKNSFSQTLFLFVRLLQRRTGDRKLKIIFKKSSSFRIKTAPDGKLRFFEGDFPFVLGLKIESFVLENPVRLFFCFSPKAKIPNFQKESANFLPKSIFNNQNK